VRDEGENFILFFFKKISGVREGRVEAAQNKPKIK
jgi:hypothetical protein